MKTALLSWRDSGRGYYTLMGVGGTYRFFPGDDWAHKSGQLDFYPDAGDPYVVHPSIGGIPGARDQFQEVAQWIDRRKAPSKQPGPPGKWKVKRVAALLTAKDYEALLTKKADIVPDNDMYDVFDMAREEAQNLWGYTSAGTWIGPNLTEYRKANQALVRALQGIQRKYGDDGLEEALNGVSATQDDYRREAGRHQRGRLPEPTRPRWASSPLTSAWSGGVPASEYKTPKSGEDNDAS